MKAPAQQSFTTGPRMLYLQTKSNASTFEPPNMALTIVDRDTAPQGFGAAFRQIRQGPERKLVEAFLEELPFSTPRGCHATVFCEPRIESGFPDLVVVLWS